MLGAPLAQTDWPKMRSAIVPFNSGRLAPVTLCPALVPGETAEHAVSGCRLELELPHQKDRNRKPRLTVIFF
ncbi:hypothetical protein AAFF_G00104710 [Aldrovandia affinis]|uniref:Uncharacterized protein n=1 Tax=Aldrovandia affinis TaxID=143900 RepID=A0AAD7WYI2_9TELE|nr:hypothetical protein AAFF_G00104710 [Aldrovandia affinis]